MDVPISDRNWSTLDPPLSKHCLDVLDEMKFDFMTPVQSATIPFFMGNKDVAVEAITGSGKTLAFVIPTVEILTRRSDAWSSKETGALVITPTRELATQIVGVFQKFLDSSLKLVLLIGGKDVQVDIAKINTEGAHVVVATPGRLVDLLSRHDCRLAMSLNSLEVLVLDEADRLLELGFEQSINTVMSFLPKQRRTGLFSATLNQNVKALVRTGMRNPVTITVKDKGMANNKNPTPVSLSNFFLVCEAEDKLMRLYELLSDLGGKKIIVFFATCASVSYFSTIMKRLLPELGVISLHGKMHKKRQQIFAKFSGCSHAVLMCTDVMARGVDFPDVNWVVQFDPPSSTKAFVHRCGRTARMGKVGQAVVFLLSTETAYVEFLHVNQHISLQPYVKDTDSMEDIVARVRNLAAKEREIYEQGKRAFVSFVHFYYKHECKLIFQSKELNLVGLAKGYALPHLPKMPELKGLDASSFVSHPSLPSDIRYRDKAREKQRKLKLEQLKQGVRPKKKVVKQSYLKQSHLQKAKRKAEIRSKYKRKKQLMTDSDLEELAMEARVLKKFKAGKITKKELEEQLDALHETDM